MATTGSQLQFTQEIPTATPGDTIPTPPVGSLTVFSEAGSLYTIDSARTITQIGAGGGGGGITNVTATDATVVVTVAGTARTVARAALTGDVTASAGSNATVLATVNASPGSTGDASHTSTVVTNAKGLVTANTAVPIAITSAAVTDFTEAAQDAVAAALVSSPSVNFAYNDPANTITARVLDPFVARVTAASKTYALTDNGSFYERINGGSAMTDTLPTLTAGDNGFTLGVHNKGATVAETITFTGAGGEVIGDTATSYVLNYDCRQTFVWIGTKWLFGAGNANLTKSPTAAPAAGDFATFLDTAGRKLTSQSLATTKTALALTGTNSGDQAYTATGDATAPSSTSTLALTLATVNATPGSYGSATSVPTFTTNAKGLTTAAGSVPVGAWGTRAVLQTSPSITTAAVITQIAIPANSLLQGQAYRVTLIYSQAATGNPTVSLRLGTAGTTADATLVSSTATVTAAASNKFEGYFIVTSAPGATATSRAILDNHLTNIAVTAAGQMTQSATPTIDTTASNFLSLVGAISASTMVVLYASIVPVN